MSEELEHLEELADSVKPDAVIEKDYRQAARGRRYAQQIIYGPGKNATGIGGREHRRADRLLRQF